MPWARAIEADTHDAWVARIAKLAVGFVTIKWTGPVSYEPEFSEALEEAFPGQQPVPVIYSLNVRTEHRGKGVGRNLMETVEGHVANRPDVVPRVALNVRVNNAPAVKLYKSLGYEVVSFKGNREIELDSPEMNEAGDWVQSQDKFYFMTKDLSEARGRTQNKNT